MSGINGAPLMNYKEKNIQKQRWENAIDIILKDKNPCKTCLIQATCGKSTIDDTSCDKLKEAILKKVAEIHKESTNQ